MIEMNPQNKNKLVLHYDMTLACNLRCSYCFKLPELDNKKLFNEEVYNDTLNAVIDFKNKNTNIDITFDLIGGDSFMVIDKAIHFMDTLEKNNIKSVCFTNFSFDKNSQNQEILKINNYMNSHELFLLNVSWHQFGNQDWIKENLLILDKSVVVLFVLSDNNIDFVFESTQWLKENTKHNYVFEYIRDSFDTKEFESFENEKFKIISQNSLNSTMSDKINLLDNIQYDAAESKQMDFVNIAKNFHTICELSQLRIDYNGNIHSTCGYHFEGGNVKNGIPPLKNVYCNSSCICGTYNYKKIGKER